MLGYYGEDILNFSLKKLHVKLLYTLLKAIFLRLLKIVNHSKMKFLILKAIKEYDEIDMEGFVSSLKEYRNQLQILEDATFGIKILATAAPDCYAKIIALNERFDVCLVPYRKTKYTESVVPSKVLEYMMIGKPIVATKLNELVYMQSKNSHLITLANTPREFARASRSRN